MPRDDAGAARGRGEARDLVRRTTDGQVMVAASPGGKSEALGSAVAVRAASGRRPRGLGGGADGGTVGGVRSGPDRSPCQGVRIALRGRAPRPGSR